MTIFPPKYSVNGLKGINRNISLHCLRTRDIRDSLLYSKHNLLIKAKCSQTENKQINLQRLKTQYREGK